MGNCIWRPVHEREYRKIIFGIRSREHIKFIAEVIVVLIGIPAGVTVRAAVEPAVSAVMNLFFRQSLVAFYVPV